MKRWPGESFEDYKLRRKETDALTAAHLRGRLPDGRYADLALHSMLTEETNLAKAKRAGFAVMMCVLSGGVGWMIGTVIYHNL